MNASTGDAHGASSLRDYLHVVRRQKWIILQAVIVVPLAAFFYSGHQPAVYRASSQVLLGQDIAAALGQGQATSSSSVGSDVATQAELARVPAIARRAVAALGIPSVTSGGFLAGCSVSSGTTSLLAFDCRGGDPKVIVRMVNEYAKQYTLYRRQLDTNAIETARREIGDKIQQLGASGTKGALYATLVEREQQLQTMEDLQTSNATVVQVADSASKVSPQPKRDAVLGLVLGVILGIGLAFLRETLDTRVRTAHEVGERLGLPLLGRVPEPPKHLRVANELAMLEEPGSIHAEAFRMLRMNLDFSILDRNVRSVMITSAVEQEGKSTTIANLAVALARGGQRVVLVDLDLRRPFVDKFFDLGDRPGITQVVLGRASIEQALVDVEIKQMRPAARLAGRYDDSAMSVNGDGRLGRLSVLGAGPIPPDPGEFVASDALGAVLNELAGTADVVLIDSPPLLHVGDAMVLSAKVDGVLLATRMERVRRPMLGELRRLLERSPAHLLGFVVTGAEVEEGYGYGYGYGHGYGPLPYESTEEAKARSES